MTDTVTLFRPFRLNETNPPPGWRTTTYTRPWPDGKGHESSFSFDDPTTGYHAHGQKGEIQYHRASLPRLVHSHNGKLIKSQAELDAGLYQMTRIAASLGHSCTPDIHLTRVDLVWQFLDDPARFIQAHRNCRHSRIRADVLCYERRSLAIAGSEMRIAIYDKRLERFKVPGDIVRVEVQLRGRMLREQLGNGDRVTRLDFNACYQAYRRILLGFMPAPVPAVSRIAHLLAIGEREGWESNGLPAFDLYTADMSGRNIRRLRRDMAVLRPAVHRIDWAELLPADGPPPAVDLDSEEGVKN